MRLLYVMDPMCGWCYGFQPELEALLAKYPNAQVDWIMGGLAPDSQTPMDEQLRQTIASYWHQIEAKSQVSFNHEFWTLNTPYRSTYPACRAVIAAETIQANSAQAMAKAIQAAYYQEAKNPSLETTLTACASGIGIDEAQFEKTLHSAQTQQRLQQQLDIARQLQVSGFPALFYIDEKHRAYPLALGFSQTAEMEQRLSQVLGVVN
ncbi:DsbA family protein [Paraferrimonas sedimenticola]|uniref:DsbA family protein n=1 Tax=Paraferrimonas sedimenticola TaxID=375674 RepID=A0AA37RWU9_9GAMM|nr:DsbA family protein [Paraferrimonas sedimenticola]GLP96675.1 DsbA family protein [Paraferrimonas sedimenticola]